jgi:cephalosporin hydroxylase
MSLEEELDQFAEIYTQAYGKLVNSSWRIERKTWVGQPAVRHAQDFWNMVHQMIEGAPLELTLTSPYPYVRGYRQLIEDKK